MEGVPETRQNLVCLISREKARGGGQGEQV